MRTTNYTEGHYAYTHAGPDGRVFYVGKGKGRRGHMLLCRAAHHQARIDAIGREKVVVTIHKARTEGEAWQIERSLIEKLKAEGAPLCNMEGVIPRKRKTHIDLDPVRAAKLKKLGSEWLNKAIDKAKLPDKP